MGASPRSQIKAGYKIKQELSVCAIASFISRAFILRTSKMGMLCTLSLGKSRKTDVSVMSSLSTLVETALQNQSALNRESALQKEFTVLFLLNL